MGLSRSINCVDDGTANSMAPSLARASAQASGSGTAAESVLLASFITHSAMPQTKFVLRPLVQTESADAAGQAIAAARATAAGPADRSRGRLSFPRVAGEGLREPRSGDGNRAGDPKLPLRFIDTARTKADLNLRGSHRIAPLLGQAGPQRRACPYSSSRRSLHRRRDDISPDRCHTRHPTAARFGGARTRSAS